MVPPTDPSARLTPFVATVREHALESFQSELAGWIGEGWTVEPARTAGPVSPAPTHLVLRGAAGAVELLLRNQATADGWSAGPVSLTVSAEWEGRRALDVPGARALLRHLAARFAPSPGLAERGRSLARAHHAWAIAHHLEDRFYRHVEHAHSGVTGLLRPGFACNQDCGFCWEGRDWPAPPADLVFTWLDELGQSGVKRLTLCGGEPTLFPRLAELIGRAATRWGMVVHMNTNAIRLRDPAYTARLRDAGLRSVMVSIHSHLADVSDRMTRAPGTWARTVQGIHGALDAGLFVVLNGLVEAENVHLTPAHAQWIVDEFVTRHPTNPVCMVNYNQPGRYYDVDAYAERIVPLDIARPYVSEAARILGRAGVLLDITGTCGFPACIASDVPELAAWRPQSAMDAHSLTGRTQAPEPCQRCAAFHLCAGARHEYVERHGARGFAPFATLPTSDWYERLGRHAVAPYWGGPT